MKYRAMKMPAPLKPWESSGAISGNHVFVPHRNQSNSRPTAVQFQDPSGMIQSAAPSIRSQPPAQIIQGNVAPPLPPRPQRVPLLRQSYLPGNGSYYPSYPGSYSNNYGGYSTYGSYGGSYGGYSSYNGYGNYGMNRYGFLHQSNPESRFIQMAEEGSRPAFESIESIVQAFGSVSFMLESTFNAMYSSFRAVLGVAENLGRLRSLFGQFLSVFAIFRWFRWVYKKGLFIIGLCKEDPSHEFLWNEASDPNRQRSRWPIIFFMGIIFTGPYLMWKLLNSLNIPTVDSYNMQDWYKSKDPIYSAAVLYDFVASGDQELSVKSGQQIVIAPRELQPRGFNNWLLATVNGKKIGLVPANYIKINGRLVPQVTSKQKLTDNSGMSSVTAHDAPVIAKEPSSTVPKPELVNLPQGEAASHIPNSCSDAVTYNNLPLESSDNTALSN